MPEQTTGPNHPSSAVHPSSADHSSGPDNATGPAHPGPAHPEPVAGAGRATDAPTRKARVATSQALKPETAAKKLSIYLPAAPAEFREAPVTRDQLAQLQADPPAWLAELRRSGPHPRQEVARRLGVSTSGLARAGAADVMTTAEIADLLRDRPAWLVTERATHAAVQDENARVKAERAARQRPRSER